MRKIYLFLAFCLMSVMPVRAEKDYVAIISPYPDETDVLSPRLEQMNSAMR
jgi:hypothetical protein